ncbi:MAG: TIR domain-containing protein, partial [Chthoniobacteraceae bacterium]|nr:TIR domain-containing protein [Chthoniobacteraceae bacterium]
LESCGQLELLQVFEAQGYDDSLLTDITEEVLANQIGIKGGGYRKKILNAIQAALAPQCPPEPAPATPDPSTSTPSEERTKIFLSYGRRDAADIAERLHRDLTAAGFDVWRDTQEIRSGSQWQDEIEAGLRSAQVVVSLLSPHAVRRGKDGDSVCLDELAFARHSPPPTPIVPAMVAPCDPPFCIYKLDYVHLMEWKSEAVYQAGLKRIIQGIHDAKEGKTSLRAWDAQLSPMDFTDYLHHKRRKFVGREWLFEEIDLWRYESEERALLITGDPGAGKSSVVAQLVHNNTDGQVIGYHCCQSDEIETLLPARFVQSLAAMIASRLPDYAAQLEVPAVAAALDKKRCESDPSGAFLEGILQPLHALPNPEEGVRYILVDALDEAMGHAGSHTIVDVLASRIERLPPWLRVVATTRKEPLILQKLSALRAKSIDASDPRNLADLGLFVRTRLQGALAEKMTIAKVTSDDVVKRISERSGGNFLYAVRVLDGLQRDHFSFDGLDKLPQGLNALYLDFFQRLFGKIQGRDLSPEAEASFQKARPFLEVLIAAREPLTIEELSEASGIHLETELPHLERRLAQILSAPLRGSVRTVALYHKSIADWLALKDHVFFVSAKQGLERLARYTASVLAKTR